MYLQEIELLDEDFDDIISGEIFDVEIDEED